MRHSLDCEPTMMHVSDYIYTNTAVNLHVPCGSSDSEFMAMKIPKKITFPLTYILH